MTEKKENIKKKRTLLQRIVKVFLYSGIALLFVVLIAFGFSQTSTFREYLRKTVIENADKALNGKLYIGKIDGTIFTSLVLRNTIVSMGNDTLLHAATIELKTSPLQIFMKRIYVRKFEIKNADISFIKDSSGTLNISRLVPPTPPDSAHSTFPFKIVLSDFRLNNVNFSLKNYNTPDQRASYKNLNLDDFNVKNLNLSLSALADIKNKEFELKISEFSCMPNIEGFSLNNLTGEFYLSSKGMYVNDLNILTNSSDVTLDAKVDDFNLFDTASSFDIKKIKINTELDAKKFNFDDLSAFVPATSLLKGIVAAKFQASGPLSDLTLKNLDVDFMETHLSAKGALRNITDPGSMYISADFIDSRILETDAAKLLPGLHIPEFKDLGMVKFDTLTFRGNPLDFSSKIDLKSDRGALSADLKMNLRKPDRSNDLSFRTQNFDLSPFAGTSTRLNSKGTIKGSGFIPAKMNTNVKVTVENSRIAANNIDTLKLNAEAKNSVIAYNLGLRADTTHASFNGTMDFSQKDNPSYEIRGFVKNLDLADVMGDSTMQSDLNFHVDAQGSNFDPEKLNTFLMLHVDRSEIKGVVVDSSRAIVDIRSDDKGERIINIISDLADITITGKFSIHQSVDLLTGESGFIADAFKSKLDRIFYPDSLYGRQLQTGLAVPQQPKEYFSKIDSSSSIKYVIEFKNFDLLSLLFKNNHLQLDGDLSGEITNTPDSVLFTFNTKLDYIKYWSDQNVFFVSKLKMGLALGNEISSANVNNISAELNFNTERLFTGKDFYNLNLNAGLKNDSAYINFHGNLEKYLSAGLNGKINLDGNSIKIDFDTLLVSYNQFLLRNRKDLEFVYSKDNINVEQFALVRDGGEITLSGQLASTGNHSLYLTVKNIQGLDISTNLLNIKPENGLGANLNLKAEVTGNFSEPVMSLAFTADSVSFRGRNFGNLYSNINYLNENLAVDVKFLDNLKLTGKPALTINGNIPVNLAFNGVQKRVEKSREVNLKLTAKDFNLGAFGNILPQLDKLQGNLKANVDLTGSLENLNPSGYMTIDRASFVAQGNNLQYDAGLKLQFKNHSVLLDSLLIANVPGTKNGGVMTGSGEASLNNFELADANISVRGNLKVLSEASKAVSPAVYGDLVIATNGNIQFTSTAQRLFLQAPIIVKEANLTFPPSASAYQGSANNFVYRYLIDKTAKSNGMDFESLVKLAQMRHASSVDNDDQKSPFDYSISVDVQNEATLKFILAKEINQSLTAIIKGNFQYENIGGRTNAQGVLTLLDGSTLQFIKTFDATGTIRFESELSNPYLDIVGTYKNYYTPPTSEAGTKEEQVEVKVKLKGALSDLSKNFIQDKSNISVLVGADNIANDKPDPTKDVSDAIMFVVAGKFTNDLSQQQQQNGLSSQLQGVATSLAGSLLGGFLNQYLGDYVKGIELRSVGSITKFNLVGKVKNFRYSIGGSTDVFQDFSQANVMIEYPLFRNLLLRVERKESLNQTSVSNDMVNELGLKYRFEF